MATDILFWVINSSTIAFLVSPLFLFFSPLTVTFFVLILPLSIFLLYHYFSLSQSQSSISQFANITIAHRGGRPLIPSGDNDDFPENTMAAYRWASNMKGADCIELDVWLSKDHIPMVSHDGYLNNVFAECKEFISSLTCEELKKLKYYKKNKRDVYDQMGCETIPTLEEVIIFIEPTRLKLMIEIKEAKKVSEIAKVINELYKRYPFLYDRAYCASFLPFSLYVIRRFNPRITTGLIFAYNITAHMIYNATQTSRPQSVLFTQNLVLRWMIDSFFMCFGTPIGLKFIGADLACVVQGLVCQKFLDEYKEAGIIVCAWTVNDLEQKRWLRANEVSVITDTLFDIDDK